jgi:hypothetical protein
MTAKPYAPGTRDIAQMIVAEAIRNRTPAYVLLWDMGYSVEAGQQIGWELIQRLIARRLTVHGRAFGFSTAAPPPRRRASPPGDRTAHNEF